MTGPAGKRPYDPTPDRYCLTREDGECVSSDPRCMHQPKRPSPLPPNYKFVELDDHDECAADLDAAWAKYRNLVRDLRTLADEWDSEDGFTSGYSHRLRAALPGTDGKGTSICACGHGWGSHRTGVVCAECDCTRYVEKDA